MRISWKYIRLIIIIAITITIIINNNNNNNNNSSKRYIVSTNEMTYEQIIRKRERERERGYGCNVYPIPEFIIVEKFGDEFET